MRLNSGRLAVLWAFLALAPAGAAGAATSFMGQINVDTRWTVAGSPYTLTGDVTVAPQATLTIDPGVIVQVTNTDGMAGGADATRVEIVIRGALIADGTAALPITFLYGTQNLNLWSGISFEPGARASSISRARIVNAGTAVQNRMSAPLTLSDLTVQWSTTGLNWQSSLPLVVAASRFENVTTGIDWQSAAALTLTDVAIDTATTGIIVRTPANLTATRLAIDLAFQAGLDHLGGASASTVSIVDSTFRSCTPNAVAFGNGVAATVARSQFSYNGTSVLAKSGSALDFTNNLVVASSVLDLDLTQNLANPFRVVNNTLDQPPGYVLAAGTGIRVRAVSSAPNFVIRNNNITSHRTYGVQVDGATPPSLDHNNVWGNATNLLGVSSGVGAISYNPLYVTPVSQSMPSSAWTSVTQAIGASTWSSRSATGVCTVNPGISYFSNLKAVEMRLRNCTASGTGYSTYAVNSSGSGAGGVSTIVQGSMMGVGINCTCAATSPSTNYCSVTCEGYDYISTSSYNYRLQAASPSIDLGLDLGAPTDDLDATPRPVDGDVNGTATTDIGAYEWHSNYAPLAAAGADRTVKPATAVAFDATPSRDADGSIVAYDWYFGDGTAHVTTAAASHTFAAVGTYTVTLTVTDNMGATGTDTAVITVANNLPPLAVAGPDQFVASFASVTFDGGGSSDPDGTIVSYAWAFGDGLTGSGPLVAHTYAGNGVYTATLTVTDNQGVTASDSLNVVVGSGTSNVLPTARPGGPYSGAVGQAITFNGGASFDGDGTIASYAWAFGDGTSGTGATPSHAYAAAGTYLATLTVIDDKGGQARDSTLVTVSTTPNQPPVARAGGNRTGTRGVALAFNGTASTDADGTVAAYLWDFGDGVTATGATPSHTWATAGSYLLKLTVTDNQGATGTDLAVVAIADPVNVLPVARAGADQIVARGATVAFDGLASSDADGSIAAWAWDFGDGQVGAGATASHAYAAAGTYLVSLTVTDDRGGRASDVLLVTVIAPVNAPPVADAGGGHQGQVSQAIAFDGRGSADADGTIVSYAWDFGDGATATGAQAWHAYATAGAWLVTLTVTDDLGATAYDQAVVSVAGSGGGGGGNAPPVASAGPDRSALVGAAIAFDGSGSSDPDGTIAAYAWAFGDGATASGATPSHAYAAPGSYLVRLTVTDSAGAQDTGYALVTISTPAPAANLPPVARAGGGKTAAPGALVSFSGAGSSDADGFVAAWAWDFGDGTSDVGSSTSHRYAAAGTYLVRLTVTDDDGATASDLALVTVVAPVVAANAPPVANAGGGRAGVVGVAVAFDGRASSDADGSIASFAWSFGDGASGAGAQPSHAYAAAGTYLARLTVTDDAGAVASDVALVTVTAPASSPNLPPEARAGGSRTATVGVPMTFSGAASSDADGAIASYAWDFGDGASATTASAAHAFAAAGTYLVRLTVTDDRGATASDLAIATVAAVPNAPPVARAGGSRSAMVGQAITLDGAGSLDADGTIAGYAWEFGDGATGSGASPSHAWAAAGTYLVKLTVTDDRGGASTDVAVVTVSTPSNQLPVARAGGARTVGVGAQVGFSAATSSDADGAVVAYAWDFGDGATAATAAASHAFATAGVYLVRLTVLDDRGGVGQDVALITVQAAGGPSANQPPVADAGAAQAAAPGQVLTLDGRGSLDTDGTIASYAWDFGDGNGGTGAQPTHAWSSAGTYLVRLVVTDDRGASTADLTVVTVASPDNRLPVAAIGGTTSGAPGQPLALSGGASSDPDGALMGFTWDFGDGATAAGSSVTHAWAAAGSYLVKLTVTDDRGATASDAVLVTVTAPAGAANRQPVAAIGGTTAGAPGAPLNLNGSTSSDPDGTLVAWAWSFGDGATASGSSVTHTWSAAGVYLVKLTVTDDRGATATDAALVTVATAGGAANRPPVASAGGSRSAEAGQAIAFSGSGSSDPDGTVVAWAWDFGDGGTASGVSASHAYASPGAYLVKLTVTDDRGATAQDVALVTVPWPPAPVNVTTKGGCSSGGAGDLAALFGTALALAGVRRRRR